jgi:hypothetical protein
MIYTKIEGSQPIELLFPTLTWEEGIFGYFFLPMTDLYWLVRARSEIYNAKVDDHWWLCPCSWVLTPAIYHLWIQISD